jgi:hypothetical protein
MNEQETIADIAQKIRDAGFDELSDHIMAAHKSENGKLCVIEIAPIEGGAE